MLWCCVILHCQPIKYLADFNLSSISFLRKVTSGQLDSIISAKLLEDSGRISSDVILMFDEIYLQKCEEFSGGEIIGADETCDLYKGLICFMIVGLKSNIPFVVRGVPKKKSQVSGFKKKLNQV